MTALITDAYNALAEAMEAAVEAVPRGRHADRVRAAFRLRVPRALARQVEEFQRRRGGSAIPAPVLAFGLGAWARVHGLVALEVFGHLAPAVGDGTALFEQELEVILGQSGLDG